MTRREAHIKKCQEKAEKQKIKQERNKNGSA